MGLALEGHFNQYSMCQLLRALTSVWLHMWAVKLLRHIQWSVSASHVLEHRLFGSLPYFSASISRVASFISTEVKSIPNQNCLLDLIKFTYGWYTTSFLSSFLTYQAFRQRRLVPIRQMLFQGQDNAVGNDGGKNHPLKWSERLQSREKHLDINVNSCKIHMDMIKSHNLPGP